MQKKAHLGPDRQRFPQLELRDIQSAVNAPVRGAQESPGPRLRP